MRLEFRAAYRSILEFPSVELPPFVLVTGLNGAGKTHLLEAISQGAIATDVAQDARNQVRLFDWTTLGPTEAERATEEDVLRDSNRALASVQTVQAEHRAALVHAIGGLAQLGPEEDPWIAAGVLLDPAKNGNLPVPVELESVARVVRMAKKQLHFPASPKLREAVERLTTRLGDDPLFVDPEHARRVSIDWGEALLFQQSFGRLFLAYFQQRKLNVMAREDARLGKKSIRPLSDEEFVEIHGGPPWDFVNETLRQANLDFEVDHPEFHILTSYTPKLTKRSSRANVAFTALSSGERVLMSFALCVYYANERRQAVQKPRMLLLDEIDAPLHPSMCRQVVDTIRSQIVQGQDIPVIMSTHSPVTVAAVPEEAVFAMEPDRPGLHKVSRQHAISLLCRDLPMLSISFAGRRQVFVESELDARRYETLYLRLRPFTKSERSLTFIGVGKSVSPGAPERDAGCARVIEITRKLVEAGNDTCFGLVDWDRSNRGDGRLVVLGEGRRYAVENCLLDPALVVALVLREPPSRATEFGFPKEFSYAQLAAADAPAMQGAIDFVQRKVLGIGAEEAIPEPMRVVRVDGQEFDVARSYLEMQGHLLEEKVKEAFPALRRHHQTGALLQFVAEAILHDFPNFAPVEILDAFRVILDHEAT